MFKQARFAHDIALLPESKGLHQNTCNISGNFLPYFWKYDAQ